VDRGEMRGFEALYRSPGEEESGEDREGEETHTFILRVVKDPYRFGKR
jgi:hypothetical protein